jgi:surfactin synthase thioesterase subunit
MFEKFSKGMDVCPVELFHSNRDFFQNIDVKMPKDCIILGFSLGSLVALSKHGGAEKLILISPFARFLEDKNYPGMKKANLRAMTILARIYFRKALSMFYSFTGFEVELEEKFEKEYIQNCIRGLNFLQKADERKTLKEIDADVHIFWAKDDTLIKKEQIDYFKKNLKKCYIHEFFGGHFFFLKDKRFEGELKHAIQD